MANLRLPEHSHCLYCGDPIPFGEEYCNETCRKNEAERVAKEKRKDMTFYIIAGITVVVILAVGFVLR